MRMLLVGCLGLLALGTGVVRADGPSADEVRKLVAQPDPKALAPVLTKALKDDDKGVRVTTVYALEGVASQEGIVTTLAGALKDAEKDVRIAAAAVIGRLGPDAKAALPAVKGALK